MPSPITIKVDISEAVKEMESVKRSIPFVAAKTLTGVAKAAQKASVDSLTADSVFELRNAWTARGIRFRAATKTNLTADVHTDFSLREGATDYLALQAEDYVKVADKGFLCIPTDALRALAGGVSAIIPDQLRPQALLNYCDKTFQYEVRRGKAKGTIRGIGSGPAVRGFVFFDRVAAKGGGWRYLTTKSGARAIWARRQNERQAVIMYVMVRHTGSIRRRVVIDKVVADVVDTTWRSLWDTNWADAFARGIRL